MQAVADQKRAMCNKQQRRCSPAVIGTIDSSLQPSESPAKRSLTMEVAINSLQLKVGQRCIVNRPLLQKMLLSELAAKTACERPAVTCRS
jgi:hypothetical protein